MDSKTQVDIAHYNFDTYVTWERWQSYYVQVDLILKRKPQRVLVIGPGDQIVVNILKGFGLDVKTLDIDKGIKPDYLVSITDLSSVVDEKFDVVLCSQVLEHLPYDQFENCLKEISKVSREHVLISLPHRSFRFDFTFKFPKMKSKHFSVVIPRNFFEFKFDGEHYWEVGAKGYPNKRIEKSLKGEFELERKFHVNSGSYHVFYECLIKASSKLYISNSKLL